jgi:hypothetical protein
VVDGTPEGRLIGIVRRADVAGPYLRHVRGVPAAPADREPPPRLR